MRLGRPNDTVQSVVEDIKDFRPFIDWLAAIGKTTEHWFMIRTDKSYRHCTSPSQACSR